MRRDQFQRYRKYLYIYLRHITFEKVLNLIKIEFKLNNNNPNIKGLFPHFLNIEISNKCNLYCPLCQMGLRQTIDRENIMNLENYKKIIIPLKNYLFQVVLYDWGEPFLNRGIYDIISFNTENNIGSVVSTNGNIPIDPYRLIDSGLDYLIISGDGITQEVYGKYRKGGDINRVFNNLHSLIEAKKKRKTKFPFIEWQCLVTKHNESQLQDIKRAVLERGVDYVRFANINYFSTDGSIALQEEWAPSNPAYRSFAKDKAHESISRRKRKPCFWLWRAAVVNVNGGTTPCCLYDIEDWGNTLENDFITVWNNSTYHEARLRSKNDFCQRKNEIICDRCTAPFIYR